MINDSEINILSHFFIKIPVTASKHTHRRRCKKEKKLADGSYRDLSCSRIDLSVDQIISLLAQGGHKNQII